MASTISYIGSVDTLYILTKLKAVLQAGWVAKDGNKQLSTEDFTTALKSKLESISASQIVSSGVKIGSITIGSSTIDFYAPNVIVDSSMSSTSENPVQNKVIKQYVDDAVGSIVGIEFRKVQALPQTGENGVIYLVPKSGTPDPGNLYEEYIWIATDSSFEKIGETSIDLSGYVQSSDLVEITTSDIDAMFTTVFGS